MPYLAAIREKPHLGRILVSTQRIHQAVRLGLGFGRSIASKLSK
jgi:hypothetical protein